ncbi:MAG TPA: hypothetical protein VN843_14035, partial [Anaerolineales bacterium]|nr:hypothetical protein [Anaerolineales bacterium]
SKANSEYGAPVKSITVNVEADQRELLFDQLRRFAKKNFFAIRIVSFPSSDHIEMWREDINIGGLFWIDDKTLSLSFHNNQFEQHLSQPLPESVFEDLMNDLQIFISEVPSAITTERRHRLIITTNDNWRNEELLAKMKALAEKHSLEYEFSFFDSDPTDNRCLKVEIHGEGFHITTQDCERDTIEDFDIEFYLDYHKNPTATSKETLDTLHDELKSLISSLDNATMNEEP